MSRGRDADKAHIKSMNQEGRLEVGDAILVKKVTGCTPGDPKKGIYPTYTFAITPSKAVIATVEQNDIMYSGGNYQVGDITVQLDEELKEVSDKVGSIGDRIVWRGSEYRVVGKKEPAVVGQDTYFHSYVCRKVV